MEVWRSSAVVELKHKSDTSMHQYGRVVSFLNERARSRAREVNSDRGRANTCATSGAFGVSDDKGNDGSGSSRPLDVLPVSMSRICGSL